MKRLAILFRGASVLCCASALVSGAELGSVHAVYLLPMYRGLDQYLANRLTNARLFQVVTDPKLADAVLTDRIGAAFESQMEDLFPPPPDKTAPPPKPDAKKEEAAKSAIPLTQTVNRQTDPSLNSAFGRGKGTVFLVDVKSRQVVWSAYEPPKSPGLSDLDRSASDIVAQLKKDVAGPRIDTKH